MRQSTRKLGLAVAAIAALAGNVFAAGPKPFVFAEEGRAKAAIVVDKDAGRGVRCAANRLADYLGKITGGRFAVVEQPLKGLNTILVGTPYKASKQEELCVRVKDPKTLEITGDGPLGTLYAVYDLLETFGVGFWAHDYETIAANADLQLAGDYKKVEAPYMTWRGMWSYLGRHDFDYCMKLRLNNAGEGDPIYRKRLDDFGGGVHGAINQNLTSRGGWIAREKFFQTHPEWYPWNQIKNARLNNGVCVSNEEMFQELFKEIEEYLEKNYPKIKEVSMGVDDGSYFCECDKCLALSRSDTNPEKAEVPGVQCIVLVNRVAKHFAKKYPDVRFNILNYGYHGPVSDKFTFEPNAGFGMAQLWRNYGLPAEGCERAAVEIDRWARLTKQGMYVWDYYANFKSYLLPFPDVDIMGPNMKYYKRLGGKGVNPQMMFTYCGNLSELHYWLLGKLTWNPDLDSDKLIDQYVEGAYGKAAPFIRRYIDLLTHARSRQHGVWIGCYVPETSHFLTAADCIQILRLFDQARGSVQGTARTDPGPARMVHRARISPLTLALFRYNDLIEPAKTAHYNLPTREKLCSDWKEVLHDSSNEYGHMDAAESLSHEDCIKKIMENPPKPTAWPEKRHLSIHIPAPEMSGGTRMTKQRDPAGFEYAQIKVALNGEKENIWMNPGFAEIGYTVPPEQAGEWYVFATVRLGATMPLDHAAAYFGIYSPWINNGVMLQKSMEIADMPLSAAAGEESWQTVCLGKYTLQPGARVWVMPGVVYPTRFADVKNFVLVDPALMEGSLPMK